MAAITEGMNPDEVEALGHQLKSKAGELMTLVGQLNGLVNNASWVGHDAEQFKGPWWDGHRAHLTAISHDLDGFGQSALNNASDQRGVSSH